jgi:hypothetical protein
MRCCPSVTGRVLVPAGRVAVTMTTVQSLGVMIHQQSHHQRSYDLTAPCQELNRTGIVGGSNS